MDKIDPGSPEAQSADIAGGNIEKLKALFPEAFAEGKIDFDVLRQLLGDAVDEGEENTASTGMASAAPDNSRSPPPPARCAPAPRTASIGPPRKTS